ncbi:MAG: phospholipid carrier-dependent glycosyltransferase [Anaerolineales bacterium]|nr:phospholipid carrier-dependent glycosyltransferase [Anaerolineales bacterium]
MSMKATGPRADARRDLVLLFVLGLAVNLVVARWVTNPGYTDAYYYFDSAVQLAHGEGFTEPYLWNYLAVTTPEADAAHRWPSHLYWMPLPALVAAPFMALAEAAAGPLEHAALFRAAQAPFIALAAGLPLLAYAVAQALTGNRRHGWAAALLTLFSPYYLIYWPTTEAFALFGLAASGALLAAWRAGQARAGAGRWLFAAGVAAGLAHLTRADGALLAGVIGLWWAAAHWRTWRGPPAREWLGPPVMLVTGYLLVLGPWFARNVLVTGAPLPPGGLRTAWLLDYNELFTLNPAQLTAARYFAAGWAAIVARKWAALQTNAASFAAVQTNLVGLPLLVWGAWRLRRHPLLQLTGLYALALFTLMTFVFTLPGERGGFFHSSVALLPAGWAVMAAGLDAAVEGAARRRKHWRPERSRPVFTGLLVAASVALAALLTVPRLPGWAGRDAGYAAAGRLTAADVRPVVTVNNPPGWYYQTGQAAIVIPSDASDASGGATAVLAAMQRFGSRWLILEANHPAELEALYGAPEGDPALTLRATLDGGGGVPLYVLERMTEP